MCTASLFRNAVTSKNLKKKKMFINMKKGSKLFDIRNKQHTLTLDRRQSLQIKINN